MHMTRHLFVIVTESLVQQQEGYYIVGSGDTGAASTLAVLGGAYFVTMLTSAFTMHRPHPGKPHAEVAAAGIVPVTHCTFDAYFARQC